MSSYYRQQLEEWIKTIKIEGSVLDVGGSEKPRKCGNDYNILDIADDVDVKWDINNLGKFEEVFKFRKGKFDTILCFEVFEYLVNPLNAILNLSDWVKDNGVVYISFPFVYPIHRPEGKDMLRYTENWIREVMGHYGFTDLEITTRNDKSGILNEFYRADGMKAQQGIDHSVTGYMVKGLRK